MNSTTLFSMAIGLQAPWEVTEIAFSKNETGQQELHLHIGFKVGSRFPDETGQACPVHDTVKRQWQHLNFFEHRCTIHCAVPRITNTNGKVTTVTVPWARSGSGFTLLFEAFAMALIEREMPIKRVAQLLKVYPQRLWHVFDHWVSLAYKADDPSSTRYLGIDETSSRKGHAYVTIGVDLESKRVIHVSEGKGKATIETIKIYLTQKNVPTEQINQMSMDLSPAYIAGAAEHFPNAQITFDRFHVVKLLNEAMDQVRKSERKEHAMLKGEKYTFLKNKTNLTPEKQIKLAELITLYPTLGEAYRLKTVFNDLWEMPDSLAATRFLGQWVCEVEGSKIPAFKKFAKTIQSHWSGIVHFAETRISNGVLEGINSKIQLAKRRARGYRKIENFIHMIYFLCGKLKFNYPLYFI